VLGFCSIPSKKKSIPFRNGKKGPSDNMVKHWILHHKKLFDVNSKEGQRQTG
jgi:hypothetical protein